MDHQSYWSGRNLSFSEDSRIQVGTSKVGHFMGKLSTAKLCSCLYLLGMRKLLSGVEIREGYLLLFIFL